MEFGLLGSLAVHDGREHRPVPAAKQRVVLAALLLRGGVVSLDELSDDVWDGRPPAGAAITLRNHVLRLRRQLGDEAAVRLRSRPPGYLINVAEDEFDVTRFRALRASAAKAVAAADWHTASSRLGRALDLWRGEPLQDIPSQRLRDRHGALLSELHIEAVEARVEADLQLGHHDHLPAQLQDLLRAHPYRERVSMLLMRALIAVHRRADALEAYRRTRRRLAEDLGIEPGPELQALHRRILADDPTVVRQALGAVVNDASAPLRGSVAEPISVLRQLPADLVTFTGRRAETARLVEAATGATPPGTVMIHDIEGMGGVGKTQLAVHVAHTLVRAGHFQDAQLYVNLHGFDPAQPPASPVAVLGTLLSQLGVPSPQIPAEVDARAAMFRDRLHGKSTLLLLDNVADEDQIRDLIPSATGCLVLVTSRRSLVGLDGAVPHHLDAFTHDEALELLARIAGHERVGAEPDAADLVVEACGRLPLAVALAAARLRSRPAWRLADLVRNLTDGGLDVWRTGSRAPRAVFDLSFDGLDRSAQWLFAVLGMHPGDDFGAPAAAAAAGVSGSDARAVLERLQDEHLLQGTYNGRYRFHDLIRSYAGELAMSELSADQRRRASRRLIDWYLATADDARRLIDPGRENTALEALGPYKGPAPAAGGFADADEALSWCDVEAANLLSCVRFAAAIGYSKAAWRLAIVAYTYYQFRGRWDDVEQTHRYALDQPQALGGDPRVRALLLRGLGTAAARRHDYVRAEECFRDVLTLTQAEPDSVDHAYGYHNLSVIAHEQKRYAESVQFSRQALAVFEAAADSYGQTLSHNAIAVSSNALGDFPQALEHGARAFDFAEARGSLHQQARAALAIGEAHYLMRDYQRALTHHRQALDLNQRAGYLIAQAETHYELGLTYQAMQEYETACDHLASALAILRQLEAPEAAIVEAEHARVEALIAGDVTRTP